MLKSQLPHNRFIVDGGYLSWIYGSSPDRLSSWTLSGRRKFSRQGGGLILVDSSGSLRREMTESYKAKRQIRKTLNPDWIAKEKAVREFRTEYLLEDPSLSVMAYPGYEADDLIGILVSLMPSPLRVIGVDKDLLQLGDWETFRMMRITLDRMTISQYAARLPKGVQYLIQTPEHVLLSLVLMGDKSDSIPRLIPPRQLETFKTIWQDPSPWKKAYRYYGEDFLLNLYLAILPGPFCYAGNPDAKAIYRRLLQGYPTHRLYRDFNPEVLRGLEEQLAP